MIFIKNRQRAIPIDSSAIKQDLGIVLRALGYKDFEISLVFVSMNLMRAYNKKYREQDKPTDILSFPYYPTLKAGRRIEPVDEEGKNLGDLIIAPLYVKKDLVRWNQTFDQRMKVLLVHGVCHLLGYDHIKDSDYRIMKKKERELLALL